MALQVTIYMYLTKMSTFGSNLNCADMSTSLAQRFMSDVLAPLSTTGRGSGIEPAENVVAVSGEALMPLSSRPRPHHRGVNGEHA